MKEIKSQLDFNWIRSLVNSKAGWRGDGQFLDLLIPALKTLKDEDIINILSQRLYSCYIWATLPGQIARNLDANDIALFREYVVRRLRTIKEEEEAELKARESLKKIKEELAKDPSYTGIKSIPEEDKFSLYTVEQFQEEIDWLCKKALDAQLAGDRAESAFYSKQASELTQRQEALQKRIQEAQAYGIKQLDYFNLIQNELLGVPAIGTYPSSTSNQAGNITLKAVMDMMEQLKKKGL